MKYSIEETFGKNYRNLKWFLNAEYENQLWCVSGGCTGQPAINIDRNDVDALAKLAGVEDFITDEISVTVDCDGCITLGFKEKQEWM